MRQGFICHAWFCMHGEFPSHADQVIEDCKQNMDLGDLLLVMLLSTTLTLTSYGQAPPPPITEDQLYQVASSLQQFVDPLPDMAKAYGYTLVGGIIPRPNNITIGMFQKKWKFHRDLPDTTVFAFGTSVNSATVPGPTIEAYDSVPTYITWENHLPASHILPFDQTISVATPKNGGVPTSVHLHGGIQEPQSDGNALAWFTANFAETGPAWTKPTYTYLNQRQLPGNLWYHDHALGLTRVNLLAGLIGAYVVRNPILEIPLNLPSGLYDRHLLIFDRSFNTDGSLYINSTGDNPSIHPQWQPEYFGDAIIVNGKAWPYMNVQRRRYRFRIVNMCNARFLNLSFNNGLAFTQVASDSTYLYLPVTLKSILLGPSEIADVVVDFSKSTTTSMVLTNTAAYPFPSGDAPDSLTGSVMKFITTGPLIFVDPFTIPSITIPYMIYPNPSTMRTRYIVLYEYDSPSGEPTHLYINGKRFSDPATETPAKNSYETWKVINLTPDNHPLHMHLALFQAIEQRQLVNEDQFLDCMTINNDAQVCNVSSYAIGPTVAVPSNERTWKNVIKMAPGFLTTVVARFGFVHSNDPYPFDATAEPGYVYHCHILDHEDNEMIRPLKLV